MIAIRPKIADLLIKDYVPEYSASPGEWEKVSFNHTIDMSIGNLVSTGFMTEDNSQKMSEALVKVRELMDEIDVESHA